MGRPREPISPDARYGVLAFELREMHDQSGLSGTALALRIGCTEGALSKNAAGTSMPKETTLTKWAEICGFPERVEALLELRRKLLAERGRSKWSPRPTRTTPRQKRRVEKPRSPRKITTAPQLSAALLELRAWAAPDLSLERLAKRTRIPRSTLHDMLMNGVFPSRQNYVDFLLVMGIKERDIIDLWEEAYNRAERHREVDMANREFSRRMNAFERRISLNRSVP